MYKKSFFKVGIFVVCFVGFTAFDAKAQGVKITKIEDAVEDTTVFKKEPLEVMPEFIGGEEAFYKFLQENLTYPKFARQAGIEGRVLVGFIVEKDGSLTNFTVTKSAAPILDEEALRVIKMMPKWIPGKHQGKDVRVQYQIPVSFTLEKNKKKKKGK